MSCACTPVFFGAAIKATLARFCCTSRRAAVPSAPLLVNPSSPRSAEYGTGPAAYVNRYRNAWPAALTNIALAVEDAKRRRGRGELKVPTGTCGGLVVTELPAPMAAHKFSWEQPQVGAVWLHERVGLQLQRLAGWLVWCFQASCCAWKNLHSM